MRLNTLVFPYLLSLTLHKGSLTTPEEVKQAPLPSITDSWLFFNYLLGVTLIKVNSEQGIVHPPQELTLLWRMREGAQKHMNLNGKWNFRAIVLLSTATTIQDCVPYPRTHKLKSLVTRRQNVT